MKKYLIVAAALFALSCGSDDKKADEPSAAAETKTSGNNLYGKWKVVDQSVNGEKRGFGKDTLQFKENGEYIGFTGVVFNYSISGDNLILTSEQIKTPVTCKIGLSEVEKGTLKLQTQVNDSTNIETVLQKVN